MKIIVMQIQKLIRFALSPEEEVDEKDNWQIWFHNLF